MARETHCEKGQKPIVIYSFNNGKEQKFKSKYAPIDIETGSRVEASNNYKEAGFAVSWFNPDSNSINTEIVRDFKIIPVPSALFFGLNYVIAIRGCNQLSFSKSSQCTGNLVYVDCYSPTYPCRDASPLNIDYSKQCPSTENEKCSIVIYHQGLIIHSAEGNCPINYRVQCGNCKDDQIKCKSNHFPGYCCHSCKEYAEEIKKLRQQVRRLGR